MNEEADRISSPTLSLVVPVYNVAPYLPRCLDSLVAQKCRGVEAILVDDGSTDDCPQILSSYAESFPSLFRLVRRDNGGLSAARNTGLEHVRGKFVAFVDSDDWVDTDYFGELLGLAERNDLDVAHGNATYHFEGRREDYPIYRDDLPTEVMTGREVLRHRLREKSLLHMVWLHLYRRDFIENARLRFVPRLIHEDVLWTTRAFLEARRVAYHPEPGYHYRQRIRHMSPQEFDRHLENIVVSSVHNARGLSDMLSELDDDPELKRLIGWQITDGGLSVFHKLNKLSNASARRDVYRLLREKDIFSLLWRNATSIAQRRRVAKNWLKCWIA